jgi:tRNA(Ile)-lysidine synthase
VEKKLVSFIQQNELVNHHDHLLIACSGGIDSMALLHYFQTYKNSKIRISCVHVDHMLRDQQSLEDLQFVEAYCHQHSIPFYGQSIPIPTYIEQEGGNVQATCRRERYRYFQSVYEHINATKLVTAHHGDDQIETILMSLTKNRSVKGLQGIAPMSNLHNMIVIRPFLNVNKREIQSYVDFHQINWREDPSNAKETYTRNRYRHQIVPALYAENDSVHTNILHVSAQLKEDDELLMEIAQQKFADIVTILDENIYNIDVNLLKASPVALQRRIILILLNYIYEKFHKYATYQLIDNLLTLCSSVEGHAEIHLPQQFIAKRSYNKVIVEKDRSTSIMPVKTLRFNEWVTYGNYRIFFGDYNASIARPFSHTIYYLHSNELDLPLIVRPVQAGDRIHIQGMDSAKKIARIFIDQKIPVDERPLLPIIATANEVIAVSNIRHSKRVTKSKNPLDDWMIIIEDDSL